MGRVKRCLPTINAGDFLAGDFLAGTFLEGSFATRAAFAAGFFLEADFFFATGVFFATGFFFDFWDAGFFLGADAFFLATTVPFHPSEMGITKSGDMNVVMKVVKLRLWRFGFNQPEPQLAGNYSFWPR